MMTAGCSARMAACKPGYIVLLRCGCPRQRRSTTSFSA